MNWKTYKTEGLKQKYVYRYLTIEKLVDFLQTSSLYLSRADCFEDNLEFIDPFDIIELVGQVKLLKVLNNTSTLTENISKETIASKIHETRENLRQIKNSIKEQQQKIFVSCWILNDVESFAMWDIYGRSGFALKFEQEYFQSLIESSIQLQIEPTSKLEELVVGVVQYQNFDEMHNREKESRLKYSFFRKHLSFNHETEYRIVGCGEDLNVFGLRFKLPEIGDIEFEIIANPRLNQFEFETYSGILSKYTTKHSLSESELKKWLNFRDIDF